jgi:hypothetical protein
MLLHENECHGQCKAILTSITLHDFFRNLSKCAYKFFSALMSYKHGIRQCKLAKTPSSCRHKKSRYQTTNKDVLLFEAFACPILLCKHSIWVDITWQKFSEVNPPCAQRPCALCWAQSSLSGDRLLQVGSLCGQELHVAPQYPPAIFISGVGFWGLRTALSLHLPCCKTQ